MGHQERIEVELEKFAKNSSIYSNWEAPFKSFTTPNFIYECQIFAKKISKAWNLHE